MMGSCPDGVPRFIVEWSARSEDICTSADHGRYMISCLIPRRSTKKERGRPCRRLGVHGYDTHKHTDRCLSSLFTGQGARAVEEEEEEKKAKELLGTSGMCVCQRDRQRSLASRRRFEAIQWIDDSSEYWILGYIDSISSRLAAPRHGGWRVKKDATGNDCNHIAPVLDMRRAHSDWCVAGGRRRL